MQLSRLATLASAIEDRIRTGNVTSSPHKEESLHTLKEGSPVSESQLKVLQESPEHQISRRRRSQSLEFLSSTNFSETLAECSEEQAEDQQPSKPETEDQKVWMCICVYVLTYRSDCVLCVMVTCCIAAVGRDR